MTVVVVATEEIGAYFGLVVGVVFWGAKLSKEDWGGRGWIGVDVVLMWCVGVVITEGRRGASSTRRNANGSARRKSRLIICRKEEVLVRWRWHGYIGLQLCQQLLETQISEPLQ